MFVVERLFPFRYWWCYAWIRCSSWLRCNKHQFIADDAGIPRIYCELLFYSGRKKVTVWTLASYRSQTCDQQRFPISLMAHYANKLPFPRL